MNKALSPLFHFSLCTLGCLYASSTQAQVTSDGTVNTQVNQNGNVTEITGGQTRGDNLFHSFRDFSVSNGDTASFLNANDIANIFSRVTGGYISDIDGLIRSNGSANLFLINPAGIVFGENASLNIGGSFYGSSASSILFEDGEFSATDLENPPVLTINAPIGLGFRDNPAPIENNSKADAGSDPAGVAGYFGLRVPDGKSFALAGGDIKANGGGIVTFGGQIELAAVGGEGALGFTSNGDNFSFSFPENLARANVSLVNGAGFLVAAGGGGDIAITSKNISINNSSLDAGILSNLGLIDTQAGDIKLDASKALTIKNNSSIRNYIFSGASGNAGNVNIQTKTLTVNNSQVGSVILDKGKGTSGNLTVVASDSIDLSGEIPGENGNFGFPGGLLAQADFGAEGQSGNINIETNRLNISNGSKIQAATFGDGNAGNLTIRASEINVFNTPDANNFFGTTINTGVSVDPRNVNLPKGNGGDLIIETDRLSIRNGGEITTDTNGEGNAGNVKINANDTISVDGLKDGSFSRIASQVGEAATGKAGGVDINTKNLFVTNGGFVSASTFGKGDASNIKINASNAISIDGSQNLSFTGIASQAGETATGNAGGIDITTKNLSVTNSGTINVETFGAGNAGNLNINTSNLTVKNTNISTSTRSVGNAGNLTVNASESIELSGEFLDENGNPTAPGGLLAQSDLDATGKGGNLTVETKRLSISNGSKIQAATFNNGDAGEIEIRASKINLFNTSNANNQFPTEISAGSIGDVLGRGANSPLEGNGGSATIETEELSINNGARINVRSDGQGNSGSLNVQTGNLDLSERAEILASTASGKGGNINLKIDDTLTMSNNSLISAQALNKADGGNVNIDANFIVAFSNENSLNGNNDIRANSDQGQGGIITINAESLLGIQEREKLNPQTNDINANSDVLGLDGTVTINTLDINPVQGATELPSNVVQTKQTTGQTYSTNRDRKANNGLAIAGRGGVHPAPDAPLNSENINNENPAEVSIPEPIETSQGKIQPARGIKVTKDGQIILTAYRTNDAGERIPEIKPNCSNALATSD